MAWTKEQQQAIDETGTNIIVSAGAGSGKTAVLTARTMRIIKSGIHVNELLILTFTKAAAAEMKERIRSSIAKEAVNNQKLNEELALIDQSYITTFDSFALSVVKKYHYLLNISNNIAISEASIIDMKKIEIMDKVFENFYENPSEKFQKLIYDFCVKDDTDLKSSILKIANKIDSFPDRDNYIENYINNYFNEKYINDCLIEYKKLIFDKIEEIKKQMKKLCLYTDGDYEAKLYDKLGPLFSCNDYNDLYLRASSIKLPVLRGAEDETKIVKDELNNKLKELKDIIYTYGNEEELINSINSTKDYTEVIINIIKEYLKNFHQYKEENEIYDFQDIALLSIKVLKENESVRNELKYTFKEIMIDEYQDTNDIQETFIGMIENNNTYCVGDIKQSIYRFRNANPYIFKNKYDNYAAHNNGIKIDLVKNFRSRKEVLQNINDVFDLIMDNRVGGAEYQESHRMVYGNTSYIEEGLTDYNYDFKVLEYELPEDTKFTKEEIEIFTIAKDIKEKINNKYQVFDKGAKVLHDITYNDFVILMDRTSDFDIYKKIFEYLGIPLTLYKDDKLNNSDDIYIIKNIIDLIVNMNTNTYDQKFKYDFISIARSYLFNLTDEEIFAYFKNNTFKESIIYKTFKPISNNLNSKSVSELFNDIITCTNMYEKIITVGNMEASSIRISKLLDIASNLSSLGYDIYDFRDYLNELLDSNYDMKYSATNSDSNSVKIMTIHKSKGLEYHICYYSGLYKQFNISDLKDRFMFDNKYGIITPYFNEGIKEQFIKYLVKNNYIEEEVSEKIRLFYVALTRAKETMIILTPKVDEANYDMDDNNTIDINIRKKYRSFSQIMNSIKFKLIKYYETIDIDNIGLTKDYLFKNKKDNSLVKNNIKEFNVVEIPKQIEEVIEQKHYSKNIHELITQENKNNMKLGIEMHEALELIDFKNPNYDIIEKKFIKDKVKKFLNNSLFKNLNNSKVYKEHEFIYEKDNIKYHGIIDLMIEYEDHIDIIDYKLSNITDENYLKQLNGYKDYVSSLENKKINIYLYSILGETLEKL